MDGQHISAKFLRPETQEALGEEGYDKGAEILYGFFDKVLSVYDTEDLHPVGRQILECYRNHGERGGLLQHNMSTRGTSSPSLGSPSRRTAARLRPRGAR